jgi:3-hydroxybenzoate 6-monooxygenase
MATQRPVLIAGGGIGGLSAAIALGRAGCEATVLERAALVEDSGAGIQLGPNATRILRALGVLDAIQPSSFRPEAIWLFDGKTGRRLAAVPLGDHAETRYGAPYLTLHRADLHAGLRAAADAAASVSLTSGFDVAGVEISGAEGKDGVTVANIDRTTLDGGSLAGADGLWSTVRKLVAPEATLRFSGATAYRALLPRENLPDPFRAPVVGLWLGPQAHLVHYPVRAGTALNVVAVVDGGHENQGWNQAADLTALGAGFTRWCNESKSLIDLAPGWRSWSLFSLAPLPRWSRGPVTLLGDAAHPVLPYLAQGAALAIEDAAALARCHTEHPDDAAAAFRAYEAARYARSARLQATARRFGRIYHLSGAARLARNFALRARRGETALRQFDWLYGGA